MTMLEQLKKLVKDEEAPTAVEYALMVACIAVVIIAGAFLLGTNTNARFDSVAGSVSSAAPH
jgi:pilus assembly protein Flp/PilA